MKNQQHLNVSMGYNNHVVFILDSSQKEHNHYYIQIWLNYKQISLIDQT